jgi:hypothetical protein
MSICSEPRTRRYGHVVLDLREIPRLHRTREVPPPSLLPSLPTDMEIKQHARRRSSGRTRRYCPSSRFPLRRRISLGHRFDSLRERRNASQLILHLHAMVYETVHSMSTSPCPNLFSRFITHLMRSPRSLVNVSTFSALSESKACTTASLAVQLTRTERPDSRVESGLMSMGKEVEAEV